MALLVDGEPRRLDEVDVVGRCCTVAQSRQAEELRQCSQMLRHHRMAMAQSEKHQVQPGKQQRLGYFVKEADAAAASAAAAAARQ